MQHQHFKECASTQKYLCSLVEKDDSTDYLISCDIQSQGIGQRENAWDAGQYSVCFSFNIQENPVVTLTSLEIAVLIVHYFQQKYNVNLKLKWPNDILNNQGEKVGGILVTKLGQKRPIVGIGLNFFGDQKNYDYPAGNIFNEKFDFNVKDQSLDIYHFIVKNRLGPDDVLKKWTEYCFHLNKTVFILDNNQKTCGTFLGVGKHGQAIVQVHEEMLEFYSARLRLTDS
jgi:BirA family transcriptional regulator, biotin operon repressor / biotin---[acetyl-CoA-carboxylase] ligase